MVCTHPYWGKSRDQMRILIMFMHYIKKSVDLPRIFPVYSVLLHIPSQGKQGSIFLRGSLYAGGLLLSWRVVYILGNVAHNLNIWWDVFPFSPVLENKSRVILSLPNFKIATICLKSALKWLSSKLEEGIKHGPWGIKKLIKGPVSNLLFSFQRLNDTWLAKALFTFQV